MRDIWLGLCLALVLACACRSGFRLPAPPPCEGIDCSGHGQCGLLSGFPVCACDAGYRSEGLDCLPDDPCDEVLCSGPATCGLLDGQPFCVCDPGFRNATDLECVASTSPCQGIDCAGRGVCGVRADGNALCACAFGFHNAVPETCAPDSEILAFTPPTPDQGALVQESIQISGRCEAGESLTLSGDLVSTVQTACGPGDDFSQLVDLAGPDGSKTARVERQGLSGQVEWIERTFIRDTAAPSLSFCCSTPAQGATVGSRTVTLEGACEDGLLITLTGDLVSPTTATCDAGTFLVSVTFSPGDGAKSTTLSQTDATGNTGSITRDITMLLQPVSLELAGDTEIRADSCELYTVSAHDADGVVKPVALNTSIDLSGEGYGNYYSDPACAVGPITTVLIPSGQSSTAIYFSGPTGETVRLMASASGLTRATIDVTVTAIGKHSQGGGGPGRGTIAYRQMGPTFDFRFDAVSMAATTGYTLIYFPDHSASPTSGDNLICLGSGTTDASGSLTLDDGAGGFRLVETDTDLPSGYDDRFYSRAGARTLLVLPGDVDCVGSPPRMLAWDPNAYLLNDDSIQFNDTEVSHMVKKDAVWTPLPGSYYGEVHFGPVAARFDFVATFRGLDPSINYTLIYYHDPWAGAYLRCLGQGISDGSGSLVLAATMELDGGLPSLTDPNYSYAKIWLSRSANIDCSTPTVVSLSVATTVFDYGDGLIYEDTDYPRTNVVGIDGSVTTGEGCKPSSVAYQNVGIPVQTGSLTFWFTGKPSSTSGQAITGLSRGNSATPTDLAVSVLFDSDATIRAWNGAAAMYDAATTVSYVVGTKGIYRFRLAVDLMARTYSVDVLSGEDSRDWVTIATDYSFRSEQAGLSSLDTVVFTTPSGDSHEICGASWE